MHGVKDRIENRRQTLYKERSHKIKARVTEHAKVIQKWFRHTLEVKKCEKCKGLMGDYEFDRCFVCWAAVWSWNDGFGPQQPTHGARRCRR